MILNPKASAGYLTNTAGRLLIRALEAELAPLGMTPAYMPVLLALQDGPKTQKMLAQKANVEQPTMTATLGRMERDGLVERAKNPDDGRSALVTLTALAKNRLEHVGDIVFRVNTKAFTGLTEAERSQLFALLHRVILNLDGNHQF